MSKINVTAQVFTTPISKSYRLLSPLNSRFHPYLSRSNNGSAYKIQRANTSKSEKPVTRPRLTHSIPHPQKTLTSQPPVAVLDIGLETRFTEEENILDCCTNVGYPSLAIVSKWESQRYEKKAKDLIGIDLSILCETRNDVYVWIFFVSPVRYLTLSYRFSFYTNFVLN